MPRETSLYYVLIVEDEYFIADDLVRALYDDGIIARGPVADPAAALGLLDEAHVDFAVVDINLGGTVSFAVAVELRRRAIPFLFLTGYDKSVVPAEFGDVAFLQKPSDNEVIIAAIRRHRKAASPS